MFDSTFHCVLIPTRMPTRGWFLGIVKTFQFDIQTNIRLFLKCSSNFLWASPYWKKRDDNILKVFYNNVFLYYYICYNKIGRFFVPKPMYYIPFLQVKYIVMNVFPWFSTLYKYKQTVSKRKKLHHLVFVAF